MARIPFNFKIFSKSISIVPKRFLGVDIGTSAIRIVELSSSGERIKLENYGELKSEAIFEKPFRTFEKNTLTVSARDVARAILAILEEAKISTREAAFSIPDFSTFFTWYNLPPMTEEELPQAVQYEARQQIPVPLGEVTLDWQIISGRTSDKQKTPTPLKILLVAVPNEIIHQYQEIAHYSKINLKTVEAEVFALSRSLVKKESKETAVLIDIGAQSTTVSVVESGIIKRSHSFDISGNQLTNLLANGLSIDYKEAETLKNKYGILPLKENISSAGESEGSNVKEILLPLIDLIISEIEKISYNFSQAENKEITKIILAGGSVSLPGLIEYFSQRLQKPIEVANPFGDIYYPPILERTLREMGPAFAIATGAAMRGLE